YGGSGQPDRGDRPPAGGRRQDRPHYPQAPGAVLRRGAGQGAQVQALVHARLLIRKMRMRLGFLPTPAGVELAPGRRSRGEGGNSTAKLSGSQAEASLAAACSPVPVGRVATTPEEARAIAQEIGGRVVVKAQVPIGGRGKAGGIQLADDPEGAFRQAQRILGMDVRGYKVARVLVEQAADIAQEFYLSITVDRDRQANVVILSAAGGMDIEEIAEKHPEKVAKLWLTAGLGL